MAASVPEPQGGNAYEELFHLLPYGVLRFDTERGFSEANPAAARILGIREEEIGLRSAGDSRWQLTDTNGNLLAAEDYPLQRAIRNGQPVHDCLVGIFNAQTRRHLWVSASVVPQRRANGHTQCWIIFHDVTDKHEADVALQESRSNLDLAQRVASMGSAVFNYRTRRWTWSEQLLRLYGFDSSKTVHDGPDAFATSVDVHDREAYLYGLEVGCGGLVPYPLEFSLTRGDGTRRLLYREAEFIEDASGVSGIIFTYKDITEAREAERQRESLQKQLYHAQRLEAVGTLASGIAHDLNNTLVPVIGLTQAILGNPKTSPDVRPLLELVERAGMRARDLVRRIVDFSRKEISGKALFDLASAVRETLKLARATVPPTITLRHDIASVGLLDGDATQIHQLLLNLIANAAQAIGDAKGEISVSLRHSKRAAGMFELKIRDTGGGIDQETQKRIFEPFFTTKGVGQGTGLGLSVVHGIVTAHGGTIEVKSTPGRGSIFTIQLPRTDIIRDEKSSDN